MAKQESQEWPPASGAFKGERVSWVAWQRSQVKVRWGPLGELWDRVADKSKDYQPVSYCPEIPTLKTELQLGDV